MNKVKRCILRNIYVCAIFILYCMSKAVSSAELPVCEPRDIIKQNYHEQITLALQTKDDKYYEELAKLATMYRRGQFLKRDYAKSIELLKQSVEYDTSGISHYELGIIFEYGYGVDKLPQRAGEYYDKSFSLLSAHPDKDIDPDIMYRLSALYKDKNSQNSEIDYQRLAATLDETAANSNHVLSMLRHGINLRDGEGHDTKNVTEATVWLCKAAQKAFPYAMKELAKTYHDGYRDQIDPSEKANLEMARIWYSEQAKYELDDNALFYLALRYEHGRVTPQNYNTAATLYQRVIDQTDDAILTGKAMFNLAMLHKTNRLPISLSNEEINALFEKSALRPNVNAQNMLRYLDETSIPNQ